MAVTFLTNEDREELEARIDAIGESGPNSGQNVDLTGYAKEAWVQEGFQQKGNYLTEVPDGYAKTEDIPTEPEDIGAQPKGNYASPDDIPKVPNWAMQASKPAYTASEVGADPTGTAASAVSTHNASTAAHSDIRQELAAINARLTAFFDSDNQTLDELSEIVAYITSNKSLIDAITTSKVSVADIVNNLTTNVANKPLSAAQGVAIKALIDGLASGKLDASKLQEAINTALAQAKANGEFDGAKGDPGRGIKSIAQTSGNGAAGTTDTYTITYTDDTTSTYTVYNGKDGYTPVKGKDYFDGDDYVLTEADKAEIAKQVENATIVQAPKYVETVEEMTDTDRPYVLASTGHIWAYMDTTTEQEVTKTDTITATDDNAYMDGYRLGNGVDSYSNDAAGYHITPIIDLTKSEYSGKTIQLHLEGGQYSSTGAIATWIQCRPYGTDLTQLSNRPYTVDTAVTGSVMTELSGFTVVHNSDTSTTITINVLPAYGRGKVPVGYMRFCGKGAVADSNIYITYTTMETVLESAWVDTGISYSSSTGDEETAAKVSGLNNEGSDPATVKLLPTDVLTFYGSAAYSDDDYTVSHLSKITYPYRADIPVPYTVKWAHREDAMRTTVAVDTKAIGTLNAYTMLTYDATGFDNYPLYNLLPGKTYYYKVTHVLSDGSLVEAKSGSFKTSGEPWRLIYIDGTQNVRDLGGWAGLDGKTVKYGKILRGAAFSDSSYPELLLTGKGRRALGELKVQAELNLGAVDTETSIAANCSYKKIGYTNYATAITDATARANFKSALEWIVECLNASKPIYMHCQGGCDRTGTLAFQLMGLLGVSESDLAKEYELSSFSSIGFGRLRTTTKAADTYDYVGMVQAVKAYSGDTITDKIYAFATDCGISADTITQFRNLMLE